MIGICMIKSLFLIVNMIIYLINFFNTNEYRAPSHPTVQNQVFQAFQKDEYLFPPLVPNSVPGLSAFLGAVLAILFGLMTVFEILAIYSGSFLLKKTKKMIEKIASMRIMSLQPPQQATENSNNPLQADSNDIVTNNQQVEQNPPNSVIVV